MPATHCNKKKNKKQKNKKKRYCCMGINYLKKQSTCMNTKQSATAFRFCQKLNPFPFNFDGVFLKSKY